MFLYSERWCNDENFRFSGNGLNAGAGAGADGGVYKPRAHVKSYT